MIISILGFLWGLLGFFSPRIKIPHDFKQESCFYHHCLIQNWIRSEKSYLMMKRVLNFGHESSSNFCCYWLVCREKTTREMKIWQLSPHINGMIYSLNQSNLLWFLWKPFFFLFQHLIKVHFSLAKDFMFSDFKFT